MKNLRVATSPLTGIIYAGTITPRGDTWRSKHDVTGDACAAVAQHALNKGGTITVNGNGQPLYEITAKDLTANDQVDPDEVLP